MVKISKKLLQMNLFLVERESLSINLADLSAKSCYILVLGLIPCVSVYSDRSRSEGCHGSQNLQNAAKFNQISWV